MSGHKLLCLDCGHVGEIGEPHTCAQQKDRAIAELVEALEKSKCPDKECLDGKVHYLWFERYRPEPWGVEVYPCELCAKRDELLAKYGNKPQETD